MDMSQISEDSIFKIGRVISVDGRVVRVKVDKTKNSSHLLYKGELLRNISVGGYIKIVKGFTSIIGKVDGEFVNEDRLFDRKSYGSEREKIDRTLKVSLLGFFKGRSFVRGIKELPLIDNECYLLHASEFNQVHNFITKGDRPITLGALSLERGQRIDVGVNSLFASHIGIFGNTGSGKSYTLAKIYRELFEAYKDNPGFIEKSTFLLIDFNGEYVDDEDNVITEKKYKHIYKVSTKNANGDKLPVELGTVNEADFWIVFLEATEKTQMPFLRRAVEGDFIKSKIEDEESLKNYIGSLIFSATSKNDKTIEKGVVLNLLEELRDCLNKNESLNTLWKDYRQSLKFNSTLSNYYYEQEDNQKIYNNNDEFKTKVIDSKINVLTIPVDDLTPIDKVRLRIVLQYFDDIIRGFSNREHLSPLLKRMDKRVDDLRKVVKVVNDPPVGEVRKNFTIVSLKDVNIHMRKILPLLLCKQAYDAKKQENNENTYLNLIIDEAHNILSEESERESEQWKDYRLEVFEEIIKEGRKFGVFVTIASQRPSDISPTIISQLHNYFLHRLINNEDIRAVEKTISYLDKVSFESLPILPTGTCIFAGLLANIPVLVDIDKIEDKFEPHNKTRTLVDQWK